MPGQRQTSPGLSGGPGRPGGARGRIRAAFDSKSAESLLSSHATTCACAC